MTAFSDKMCHFRDPGEVQASFGSPFQGDTAPVGKLAIYFVFAGPCVMTKKKRVLFLFASALYLKMDKHELVMVSLSLCLFPPQFGDLEKSGILLLFL